MVQVTFEQKVLGIVSTLSNRGLPSEARYDALDEMCELVGGAFGDDGLAIGRAVRANGSGISALASLAGAPDVEVRMQAVHVIANLCSDAVDAASATTKLALLNEPEGPTAVVEAVLSDEAQLVLLACGALQNLCTNPDWCQIVTGRGVLRRLEELLAFPDPMMCRYASGALKNIIQAAHRDLEAGGVEDDWAEVWLSEDALAAVDQRAIQVTPRPHVNVAASLATRKPHAMVARGPRACAPRAALTRARAPCHRMRSRASRSAARSAASLAP